MAHPEETWDRLAQHLDDWTARWRDAATSTCEAAELEQSIAPELALAARDCLQERRWALEELLVDLDDETAAEAYRLLPAALRLPAVGDCTDEVALQSRPRPALDPAVREAAEPLRRALAVVGRLDDRGHPTEALARALEVLSGAEALDDPALLARAHLTVGALQNETGAFADAQRTSRAAWASRSARAWIPWSPPCSPS